MYALPRSAYIHKVVKAFRLAGWCSQNISRDREEEMPMLEYPESHTIARQMQETILGKTIASGEYVHPNANIFNPEGAPERYCLAVGGTVTGVQYHAPDICVMLDNGYGIQFRQGGGKICFYDAPSSVPPKYNFRFSFEDGSGLTYSVLLWSYGVDVMDHAAWMAYCKGVDESRFQPMSGSLDSYMAFVQNHMEDPKQAVKVYLTKSVAGIMSTFAGEILLHAGIHPAIQIGRLDAAAHERLYAAMQGVLQRACEAGGRTSEVDLYGRPGAYLAMSERKHIGEPCPLCAQPLAKASVGGVVAYCPKCQAR